MTDATTRPGDEASGRRLLNATAVMASGTMISRILGFVRTMLLAFALGNATRQIDVFNLATIVPNSLYMIFAGGALNTVLVPQIVRHIKHDRDEGEAFVNRIVTAFLVVLVAVTVLACFLTPQIMWVWAGTAWHTPAMAPHWDQLVLMAYITMPQLFFYGAFFLVGQVLNAHDKFGPMMWAPILNNVVSIGVLALYISMWGTQGDKRLPFTDDQVLMLGIGSTAGILLQTLALIPAARQIGFRYRPRFDLKGQGLGATFHLAKWMLGYVLLTQLVGIVVSKLASNATASAATHGAGFAVYQEAYLVWILPHSLLTVSLATAMLPSASRLAAVHDMAGVGAETMRTMRLANTFLLPSAVGFLVLAGPFTSLVFGHGAGEADAHFVATTLQAFAIGLVPYTIQYVYLRGYYALEDTRTPFFIQIVISGVNAVVGILLVTLDPNPARTAPWLALAYSVSYFLGAWLTHRALKKRLPTLAGRSILQHVARLALAVLPGAILAAAITWFFARYESKVMVFLGFLLAMVAIIGPFFFVAKRLGIAEASQLISIVMRRRPAADTPPIDPAVDSTPEMLLNAAEVDAVFGDEDDAPAPLLSYPDPADGHDPATAIPDGGDEVSDVQAGQLLGRYRLDEVLSRRSGTLTWRAFDTKLSRPVLLHVLAPNEPRTLEILDEARRAAPATDSRFLRVLDTVLVEGEQHGSYIVCEYAPGQSLELVLRQGALSEAEAAWVVREVADGLVPMHNRQLYHKQLNPDTVVITASGNVKIVGFLLEAAIFPEPDDDAVPGEVQDVDGLGRILYAALLARWPGRDGYGLPRALEDTRGRLLMPRQVRAGVSPAVNEVVERILGENPSGRRPRLTSAQEVANALSAALSGTDASHDLEQRLRFPLAPLRLQRVSDATLATSALAVPPPTASVRLGVDTEDAAPDEYVPAYARTDLPDSARRGDDEHTQAYNPELDESTNPFTPVPPPPPPGDRTGYISDASRSNRRTGAWLKFLVLGVVAVLVVSLVMVFVNQVNRYRAPAGPSEVYGAVGVRVFDPRADGGDAAENTPQAQAAIDGQPATSWPTERYGRSADFNGRKPGVGLVLDLGETRTVEWVTLDLGPSATQAEIRVPTESAVTAAPLRTINEWRVIKPIQASSGSFTVKLDRPVQTRFVLVYLTRLPQAASGRGFQGEIVEMAMGR